MSKILDVGPEERAPGTLAAQADAAVFRAHETPEPRQTVEMVASTTGDRRPSRVERYLA